MSPLLVCQIFLPIHDSKLLLVISDLVDSRADAPNNIGRRAPPAGSQRRQSVQASWSVDKETFVH